MLHFTYANFLKASWGIGHGIIHLRTAKQPEGPWTSDVRVFKDDAIDGGFVYAGVAHPYLDESGRTLTVRPYDHLPLPTC